MTANAAVLETTLIVRRTFPTTPEVLYNAWTQPDQIKNWFSPKEEIKNSLIEIDLKVGGRYRVCMSEEGQPDKYVSGEYLEVVPNQKLKYTWMWENLDFDDTHVTVEFVKKGNQTELILTHERFPEKQMRDHHNEGWNGCINRLETYIAKN